jgi:surfeit locus 1 family protein
VVVAGIAVLISLGLWQLERKAWKEQLIQTLQERLSAAPAPLPLEIWSVTDAADLEFLRVVFRATFDHSQEALVYTVGSALRPDVAERGYWVFTPAKLADGRTVVVNRGFVPDDRKDPRTRAAGQVDGALEIVGVLRRAETRGMFTPKDDSAHNVWYLRDHRLIAAAKGWGDVGRYFIDQDSPPVPGGLPRTGPLTAQLRNEHLQYALTWFGLAGVFAVGFGFWVRSRRAGQS